jgi:hypothetical protein
MAFPGQHQPIRCCTRCVSVDGLVEQVDDLLVYGLGPWRGTHACCVFQDLVVEQSRVQGA